MNICLDTNVYSLLVKATDFQSKRLRIFCQTAMETAERLLIPVVVYGELLAGFRGGTREMENKEKLHDFLGENRVEILNVTPQTAEWYATLRIRLRSKGKMIPMNDLWIASLVAQAGCQLLTLDKHFQYLPEILVLNPEESA